MVMLMMVTYCECGHVQSDKAITTEGEGKEMTQQFKVGDRVRLTRNEFMRAPVGAEAVVVGHRDAFVTVEWVRGKGVAHTQMDGNYSPVGFELVEPRKDTPKIGDTVRVVLEGKIGRSNGDVLVINNLTAKPGVTIWQVPSDVVKSVEIITPAKPSVKDLPVDSVVRDPVGVVYVKRDEDCWRATDGRTYSDRALEEEGWVLLVEKGSE